MNKNSKLEEVALMVENCRNNENIIDGKLLYERVFDIK